MNTLFVSVQRNLDIIALKCLHHYLLANGRESHLLYLPEFNANDVKANEVLATFIRNLQPGLIGVSAMAIDYGDATSVTEFLRATVPGTPIVWGGILPTTAPEMCLRHADYVCVGEGEQTMLDLANALARGDSTAEIPNLCFYEGETLRSNPPYPLVEDLDSLPITSRIPPNSYAQIKGVVRPVDSDLLRRHQRWAGGIYKIMTSRGCPYACAYCCNNFLRKLYGKWKVRRRGVNNIITELECALREGPPLTYVDFSDDCFLSCDIEYLREFCREYKARIGKPFVAKGAPRYFSREKMDLVTDAGMAWANMGLQSGSERVCRDIYERSSTPDDFLDAARLIGEYPVAAYYDVIVDNPYEEVEDSLATVETLMKVPRPFHLLIMSLSFFYGTDLFDRYVREHPEKKDDCVTKDFYVRDRGIPNTLIEMSNVLPRPALRFLLRRFKAAPDALSTKFLTGASALLCRLVLSPLLYFRLIKKAQGGSFVNAVRALPIYFSFGIVYYLNSFDLFKRKPSA